MAAIVMTKTCSKCQRSKPTSDFYADKRRNDGLKSHCKRCHNRGVQNWQRKNRFQDLANKRSYMRARRASQTPEERLAEKEAYRAWRQNTPAREALRCARRRARKANALQGDSVLLQEYANVLQGDPCSYCGAPMRHLDHIVPLDNNGPHDWTNLTAACEHCNSSKNANSLLLWML